MLATYDRVASHYAARFYGELEHKPLDRALLRCFAEMIGTPGPPVADVGCGPGQASRFLSELGVETVGIDLSPAMVERARALNPTLEFKVGDMRGIDAPDDWWGGIVAFYAIVHSTLDDVSRIFTEFHRVLRPGGLVLMAFQAGDQRIHLDEWWGVPVSIEFQYFETAAIESQLEAAGFTVEASLERRPYADVEQPSRRAYVLARKSTEEAP